MSRPDETDHGWLREAREGNATAFGHLVIHHQDAIYGFVRRQVQEVEVAEELTQDVFVKAFRGLDRFRGDSAFRTWLYRIAVNHVRDYRSSRAAKDLTAESPLDEVTNQGSEPVSLQPTPEASATMSEMEGFLARSLDSLDPGLKEAFLLRHQEGTGYDEIASILGISRSNAKVKVHRARERILGELRILGYDV